ncbi:hypothetical protein C8R48DRAFT_673109 [Suillus tomentosus]|nr:hypothetical protein C8R48DRAFT_673109 [Suillus tomentosus]
MVVIITYYVGDSKFERVVKGTPGQTTSDPVWDRVQLNSDLQKLSHRNDVRVTNEKTATVVELDDHAKAAANIPIRSLIRIVKSVEGGYLPCVNLFQQPPPATNRAVSSTSVLGNILIEVLCQVRSFDREADCCQAREWGSGIICNVGGGSAEGDRKSNGISKSVVRAAVEL